MAGENFPQAVMTYSAIPEMVGGVMTVSRGITPGVALLRMPTKPQLISTVGDLVISYNGQNIIFRNCAANTHTLQLEPITHSTMARRDSPRMWTIQVLDRRWAWRYKKISGEYNVRMPNGDVRYSTKHLEIRRSLYDLAVLCLEAMDEVNFDCSALPHNVYPYVNWENANPASELQTLCDMVGCVVVYEWDPVDRVSIHQLGDGDELPTNVGTEIHDILPVTVARKPDRIAVECWPTRYQIQFEMEAVGMEHDGKIKKLDDLSYKPTDGWDNQWWCSFPETALTGRDMAFRTVFRWYRIKGIGMQGTLMVPGVNETIKSIDQFELEDVLLEHDEDFDGMPQTQRARITGEYWPQCPWEAVTAPQNEYNSSAWRILPDHKNIVEFDYPVLKITDGVYEGAKLFITCACKIRKADGDWFISATYDRGLPWQPTGAGTRILRHPELWDATVIHSAINGGAGTAYASAEANVYLNYIQSVYNSGPSQDLAYDGIVRIRLDGAIAQVQWKAALGEQGKTRASRNHEFDAYTPSMEYRRRQEKVNTVTEMELL